MMKRVATRVVSSGPSPALSRSFRATPPANGVLSYVGGAGILGVLVSPSLPGGQAFLDKNLPKSEHRVLAWIGAMGLFGTLASMGGGGKKEEAPADDAGGDEEKVFMGLFKEVPNGADECCDEAEVGAIEALVNKSAPTDWQYVAEGALNMVARYVGNEPALVDIAIRMRKKNPEADPEPPADPWVDGQTFQDVIVAPLLGRRYVQPNLKVVMGKKWLTDLDAHLWPHRPARRQATGHHISDKYDSVLIMPNNTAMPTEAGNTMPTFCVELKPKWGFQPSSQFIKHPVKKEHGRFTMHQITKAEKDESWQVSGYDPLDLFSYDSAKVRSTLELAVQVPQNNFRLFVNQSLMFDEKTPGKAALTEALQKAGYQGSADSFLEALTEVMCREPLLNRVKTMQMMDDLDIEGLYPVYEEIIARGEKVKECVEGGICLPRQVPTSRPVDPAEQHEAVRRYLVSTTAKDCSLMITMRQTGEKAKGSAPPGLAVDHDLDNCKGLRVIAKDLPGWHYSCAAVDLDPKPVAKIPKWYKDDQQIAKTFEAHLKAKSRGF